MNSDFIQDLRRLLVSHNIDNVDTKIKLIKTVVENEVNLNEVVYVECLSYEDIKSKVKQEKLQ